MSILLDEYRTKAPDDKRSDLELINHLGNRWSEQGVDLKAKDPEFAAKFDEIQKLSRPSLKTEFVRGAKRGAWQTAGTVAGGLALASDAASAAFGDEGLNIEPLKNAGASVREWAMDKHAVTQDHAEDYRASIRSYKGVDDIGEAVRFATGLGGELAPTVVETAATFAVTGGVGYTAGKVAVKKAIQKQIAKGLLGGAGKKVVKETRDKAVDVLIKRATKKAARRAAGAGAVMSGVWQNAGETYGELYNSAATQGDRIRASLVAGSIAGALDAAIPLIVLKRVFPTNVASKLSDKALKRTAIETLGENLDKAFKGYTPLKRKFFLTLAKDTSNEAWTETAQEMIQEVASAYADPDYEFNAGKFRERIINAAIAGAIGGAQFGAVGAAGATRQQAAFNQNVDAMADVYQAFHSREILKENGEYDTDKVVEGYDRDSREAREGTEGLPEMPLFNEDGTFNMPPEEGPVYGNSSELDDLISFIQTEALSSNESEGAIVAVVSYTDPQGNKQKRQVSGESLAAIKENAQRLGATNINVFQVNDDEVKPGAPSRRATKPATASERTRAENILKKANAELSEEEHEAAVDILVEEARGRLADDIVAPELDTVKVDLSALDDKGLLSVQRQLRQKLVNAREAEKAGGTVLGGSASIELDYEAVKRYREALSEDGTSDIPPTVDEINEESANAIDEINKSSLDDEQKADLVNKVKAHAEAQTAGVVEEEDPLAGEANAKLSDTEFRELRHSLEASFTGRSMLVSPKAYGDVGQEGLLAYLHGTAKDIAKKHELTFSDARQLGLLEYEQSDEDGFRMRVAPKPVAPTKAQVVNRETFKGLSQKAFNLDDDQADSYFTLIEAFAQSWGDNNNSTADEFYTKFFSEVRSAEQLQDGLHQAAAAHVSPYEFDRFLEEFMGKGEGNQSFGWGFYFSNDEDVVDGYHRQFTDDNGQSHQYNVTLWPDKDENLIDLGKSLDELTSDHATAIATQAAKGGLGVIRDGRFIFNSGLSFTLEGTQSWKAFNRLFAEAGHGMAFTRENDIGQANNRFVSKLALSAGIDGIRFTAAPSRGAAMRYQPTSRKSTAVGPKEIKRLQALWAYVAGGDGDVRIDADDLDITSIAAGKDGNLVVTFLDETPQEYSAEELFDKIYELAGLDEDTRDTELEAFERIASAVKLLDGGALKPKRGTYNFVVFSDTDVQVDDGPLTETLKQADKIQNPDDLSTDPTVKGTFRLLGGRAVIEGRKGKADISTGLHEFSHVIRETPGILSTEQHQVVYDWLGVAGEKEMTTDGREKFARAFEVYLRNGHAPTPELSSVFAKLSKWMTTIYESIKGSPLEDAGLTPELVKVFDSLLTPKDAEAKVVGALAESSNVTIGTLDGKTFDPMSMNRDYVFYSKESIEENSILADTPKERLEKSYGHGRSSYTHTGAGNKGKKVTRRAVALLDPDTGEVEIRGVYNNGASAIFIHKENGDKNGENLNTALKAGKVVLGLIAFPGVDVQLTDKEKAYLAGISADAKEIQANEKLTPKKKVAELKKLYTQGVKRQISRLMEKKGGFKSIYYKMPAETFESLTSGEREGDIRDSARERMESGAAMTFRVGEGAENMLQFATRDDDSIDIDEDSGDGLSKIADVSNDDEVEDSEVSEGDLIVVDDEGVESAADTSDLFTDEPSIETKVVKKLRLEIEETYAALEGLFLPAEEVRAILDSLDGDSRATIEQIEEALEDEDLAPKYSSATESWGLKGKELLNHFDRTIELINVLHIYIYEKGIQESDETGGGTDQSQATSEGGDLRTGEQELGGTEAQGVDDVGGEARPGPVDEQTAPESADPAAVQERESGEAATNPPRVAADAVLEWERYEDEQGDGGGIVAYVDNGDSLWLEGGPKEWTLYVQSSEKEDLIDPQDFIGTQDEAIAKMESIVKAPSQAEPHWDSIELTEKESSAKLGDSVTYALDGGEPETVTITDNPEVGDTDSVNSSSPIGKALLRMSAGEEKTVTLSSGERSIEVYKVAGIMEVPAPPVVLAQRVNSAQGIDRATASVTASIETPFKVDKVIDEISDIFGAEAESRVFIRDLLESVPGEKLQGLDIVYYEDSSAGAKAGEYLPRSRVIRINTANKMNTGDGVAMVFTHELGHLFAHEVLGMDFVMDQWQAMSPEQRSSAWQQYTRGTGIETKSPDSLLSSREAASEWAAMQFHRVAAEGVAGREKVVASMKREGMQPQFIDQIVNYVERVTKLFRSWMGDAQLTTVEMEQALTEALGGTYTRKQSIKADNVRQGEFLLQKAFASGFDTVESWMLSGPRGIKEFTAAAKEWREGERFAAPAAIDQSTPEQAADDLILAIMRMKDGAEPPKEGRTFTDNDLLIDVVDENHSLIQHLSDLGVGIYYAYGPKELGHHGMSKQTLGLFSAEGGRPQIVLNDGMRSTRFTEVLRHEAIHVAHYLLLRNDKENLKLNKLAVKEMLSSSYINEEMPGLYPGWENLSDLGKFAEVVVKLLEGKLEGTLEGKLPNASAEYLGRLTRFIRQLFSGAKGHTDLIRMTRKVETAFLDLQDGKLERDFEIGADFNYGGPQSSVEQISNPALRDRLKSTNKKDIKIRTDALAPQVTGRVENGKRIVLENAAATHKELRSITFNLFKKMKDAGYEGDFESFYRDFTDTPLTPKEADAYIKNFDIELKDTDRKSMDADRKRVVDDYVVHEMYEAVAQLDVRIESLEAADAALVKKVVRMQDRLEKYNVRYNDAIVLEREGAKELGRQLKTFGRALKARGGAAENLGRLGEIVRDLEGKRNLDNRIARKYLKGIEGLLNAPDFELFDLLETIADSGISLNGSMKKLRKEFSDSKIVMDDVQFAAVIAIARADKQILSTIILRKLPDAKEKMAIVESEVAETNGDITRAQKATAKIQKYSALKGRLAGQRAAVSGIIRNAEKMVAENRAKVAQMKQARAHFDIEKQKGLGRIGATTAGAIVEGVGLFNPGANASRTDLLKSIKTFKYDETSQDDVTRTLIAQKKWLQGPVAESMKDPSSADFDPVLYNQVVNQVHRLSERTFRETVGKSGSLMGPLSRSYYDALANSFDKTNTRAGRAIAQMLQRIVSNSSALHNKAAQLGEKSDKSRVMLGRQLGLTGAPKFFVDLFNEKVDTPMKFYMMQDGATIDGFVKEKFPQSQLEVKALIKSYYKAEVANSTFIKNTVMEAMNEAGLGVITNDRMQIPDYTSEEFNGLSKVEQHHRNQGTATFMMAPNYNSIGIISELKSIRGFSNVLKLIQDPETTIEAADAAINEFFSDSAAYDKLVGGLARKDKVTFFFGEDGELTERAESIHAYESSTSPANFLRSIAGGDTDAFNKNFRSLRDIYAEVYKTVEQQQEMVGKQRITGENHLGMDARKTEGWPAEWVQFRSGGATSNNLMVNEVVIASVFGKNKERLEAEQRSLLLHFHEIKKKAIKANDVKKAAWAGDQYSDIQGRLMRQLQEVLGSQMGPLKDHKLGMEIVGTQIAGVLNGPRAAMVQLNQIYQPLLHFGLSGTTARFLKTQLSTTAQDMFGSLFEAIGITIKKDDQAFQTQKRLFGLDPEKINGFFEYTGDMGVDGSVGKWQGRVRRLNKLVAQRGISTAQSETALYSSFKPWAPFSQLIGGLSKAPMVAMRSEYDRMIGAAIKQAGSKGDISKIKWNAKEMGYGQLEFERLNGILEYRVGTTLKDLVARHRDNKGQGSPFTDNEYRIISSLGLDLMASEANVFTTRSPQMHSQMGKFIFPLLGWAIHQPHHAAKMFKGADGEVNRRTVTAGAMTLAFGLVPAVMAMSMFEDWFDEEIMGKKRNLRPLTGDGVKGGSLAVLERVTRNGMLGMPMELVNLGVSGVGGGDMRTASLDQRVFLVNSIRSAVQLAGNVYAQRTITSQDWIRGAQLVGGNGILQQIDMFSNLLDMDHAVSRRRDRINASNYLKVGGRMVGLEMRGFAGGYRPTPITPYVAQMQLASLANDPQAFQDSYRDAIDAAKKHLGKTGPNEAEDYVTRRWTSGHPLKNRFKTSPTPEDYQKILSVVGERGSEDIQEMVNNYNRFGSMIGATPFVGKVAKRKQSSYFSATGLGF